MPRFRFSLPPQHLHRWRAFTARRRPGNVVFRFILGVVGFGLLLVLLVFAAIAGTGMLIAHLLHGLWRGRGKPMATSRRGVLDGDYRVVTRPALTQRP